MKRVAFVAPYLLPTSMRFVRALAGLEDSRLALISCEPIESVPDDVRRALAGHWRVQNALDPGQLAAAGRGVAEQMGGLDRLLGVLEHMQVQIAEARHELGVEGLDPESAANFRDKERMKSVFDREGVPCARHGLAEDREQAFAFAADTGYPLVLKPPAGAGAASTYRVDDDRALGEAIDLIRPTAGKPVLLEEFIVGEEHSFDSVFVGGRPVWHSLTRYLPAPLDALRNAWIQYCVLLPREVDDPRYDDIREAGFRAVAALGLRTGLSHMEWFRRPDGSIAISEAAARPPGAQITTLMSYAHDFDIYDSWGRLMVHDVFEPPQRRYAAGVAFLRGMGSGRVAEVRGLDEVSRRLGDLVVASRIPSVGQPAASGASAYEGEGFVVVRHPETAVVEAALAEIVTGVRVVLAE
ncbi:MAG: ATP-grasp domain-containing protein [Thermoanaerobaculia bacterium]|nr:ATP-grasp domain-containing protein [Thermoanaerobaculia bacterium]